MLAAAITNYLLRGDGPFHMVMKGDDLWKRQCNLMLDRLKVIQKYIQFNLKVMLDETLEYCGNIMTPNGMYPNLQRKLYKVLSFFSVIMSIFVLLRDFMNLCLSLDKSELMKVCWMYSVICAYIENLVFTKFSTCEN